MVSVGEINGNRISARFATQAFALATLNTGAVEACRSEMGVRHDKFVLLFPLFYTVGGLRIE